MNSVEIGKFIKQLREEKGLSQEQLAEATNVSRSVIGKLEVGERIPTTDYLHILSEFFEISTDELLSGHRSMSIHNLLMNYNFFCVYELETNSPYINITSGIFVATKEKVILKLTINHNYLSSELQNITLFYKDNDKECIIEKGNKKTSFSIEKNNGEDRIIDYTNIEKLINNTYLKIDFANGNKKIIKIDYQLIYNNNKNIFIPQNVN